MRTGEGEALINSFYFMHSDIQIAISFLHQRDLLIKLNATCPTT